MIYNVYLDGTNKCHLLAVINANSADEAIKSVNHDGQKIAFLKESSFDCLRFLEWSKNKTFSWGDVDFDA